MNLGDVKTRVKRQFGDEAAVQVTDSDIERWVNDAQRDIVMRNETVLQKSSLTDSVGQQQAYALPDDLLILRALHWKNNSDPSYYRLKGMSFQEFDEYIDGWDGTVYQASNPMVYTIFEKSIKLFPTPAETGTENLKIFYNRQPVDLLTDEQILDLPIEYHNAVVSYCLTKAYELDEDWPAATNLAQQKEADIRLNKERESWNNTEHYPRITVLNEDLW